MVYWESLGSRPQTVWLKYLGQALETWRILLSERPAAVFVMTPPVVAPLVVWMYCAISGSSLVLDAHTAAFLHPRWRRFQWLQFWLCRRAATTIVHNDHLRTLVESRGGHATVVADVPVQFDESVSHDLPSGFNIAVVCSFNPDEPIADILSAARILPDVHFHVTGDPKLLEPTLRKTLPSNVRLTGFLPSGAYGALIRTADAVMTLTTRDHTMLRGAWEAVYQGTPVIISNWNMLREFFNMGAIHVDNTPKDIARAVEQLRLDPARYREGVLALRRKKQQHWAEVRDALQSRLRR